MSRAERRAYGMVFNEAGSRAVSTEDAAFRKLARFCLGALPKVEIKIGARCNINCVYCYAVRRLMSTAPRHRILADGAAAHQTGIRHLMIAGNGEVTLRTDAVDLVRELSAMGFTAIELLTNGLVLYQPALLDAYVEAGVTALLLHASASEPRLYDKMVARRGTFDVFQKALKEISRQRKLDISVCSVVNRVNLAHLPDLAAAFKSYAEASEFHSFFHYLSFYSVAGTESSAARRKKRLMPRMSEAAAHVKKALERVWKDDACLYYAGFPLCVMRGFERYSYNLHALPAAFGRDGNGDGYQVDLDFQTEIYAKGKGCSDCAHGTYCPGVYRAYVDMFGWSEFRPVR